MNDDPHLPSKRTIILLMGSCPSGEVPLELTREFHRIQERLHATRYRDRFQIQQQWCTAAESLQDLLMRFQPDIVQFSGHGSAEGDLLFEYASGQAFAANKVAIARAFELLAGVRCVVLNACYSARQARFIAQYVDVVVGMNRAIKDRDASVFAAAFYQALGNGKSAGAAFELARNEIDLRGYSDADALRLHAREGVDPNQVFFHVVLQPTGTSQEPEETEGELDQSEVEQVIGDFFSSLFSPGELIRQLKRLPGGRRLCEQLPIGKGIPAELVFEAADLVVERKALGWKWFETLAKDIPKRKAYIMKTARYWRRWEDQESAS